MIIAMSCTRNWYQYLMVDLYALLSTNKVKKIYLFLEDNNLNDLKHLERFNTEIIIINYNNFIDKYFENNDNKVNKKYTAAALVRLVLSKEIKEEKILYLDTDAIVDNDISCLWNTELKDNYIAAIPECNPNTIAHVDVLNLDHKKYVNSGVLLLNLRLIRQDKIDDKWIKILNDKLYLLPDQDAINIVCKNRIVLLDNKYNSSTSTGFSDDICIMHYVELKEQWIKYHYNNEIWYTWERRYQDYIKSSYDDKGLKIDLIIPIFKATKYLEKALISISKQSIANKVLVTIINDGDKEDYSEIIKKYKEILNINYIKLNWNKGVGYAREYALNNTFLPYFTFLDADDEFYNEYSLERLYNLIQYNNKCHVVTGTAIVQGKSYKISLHLWGRIYSRAFLQKNNIHFNKKARIAEDGMFNFEYFSYIKENESENINNIIIKYNTVNNKSLSNVYDTANSIQEYLKYVLKSKILGKITKNTALKMMQDLNSLNSDKKLTDDNKLLIHKIYLKIEDKINSDIYFGKYEHLKQFITEISKY